MKFILFSRETFSIGCREILLLVDLSLEDTHEGQIAVFLVVIEAVADDELVGNGDTAEIGGEVHLAAGGLIQQGAGADAVGVAVLFRCLFSPIFS